MSLVGYLTYKSFQHQLHIYSHPFQYEWLGLNRIKFKEYIAHESYIYVDLQRQLEICKLDVSYPRDFDALKIVLERAFYNYDYLINVWEGNSKNIIWC